MKHIEKSAFIGRNHSDLMKEYKILHLIGEGAYSQVYLARHKVLKIKRCIKYISKSNFTKSEHESIMNEIKILKKVDHPNLLKIIEYFEKEDDMFIITEYLRGEELFEKITKLQSLNEKHTAKIMKQILSAVCYMHSRDIIHRDLKPENIIFENKNLDLKIIDFGTSREIKKNENLKEIFGTPYYIAPEVLNKNYNKKCDIWSCGVIMYILISGSPPFNGKSNEEISFKIKKGSFTFKEEEWKYVSIEAKDLIRKMLVYDFRKRYNADSLLNHTWFDRVKKNKKKDLYHFSIVFRNMMNFQLKSKLQKAIYLYYVNFFDIKDEHKRLLHLFREMDTESHGEISKQDVYKIYYKFYDKVHAVKIVDTIFENLELNHEGYIDFSEFCMANFNYKKLLNEKKIWRIFCLIDTNKNGEISFTDLEEFFHYKENHNEFVRQLLGQAFKDRKKVINFEEFSKMLK